MKEYKMNKLNKKALSKAVDIELKECEMCLELFIKSDMIDMHEDMWRYTNNPTEKLFCFDCYEYQAAQQAQ